MPFTFSVQYLNLSFSCIYTFTILSCKAILKQRALTIVPATPNGELAKALKEVAERESEVGVKFKVVEGGGRTVKTVAKKSNPKASPGCGYPDCMVCQDGQGSGGNCLRTKVQYEVRCRTCPADTPSV